LTYLSEYINTGTILLLIKINNRTVRLCEKALIEKLQVFMIVYTKQKKQQLSAQMESEV